MSSPHRLPKSPALLCFVPPNPPWMTRTRPGPAPLGLSALSPIGPLSPIRSGPATGSAHHRTVRPTQDRLSLPLPLCLYVCALNPRARFLLSFSPPCGARPTVPCSHDHSGPRPTGPIWTGPTRPAPRALFAHHTGRGRTRPHWTGPDPARITQAVGICALVHSDVFSIFAFMDLACPLA